MFEKIWKHYFLPLEKNNQRADILKPNFLLFIIVLYLFSQSVVKSITNLKPGVLGYSSQITVQKVLDQTNYQRQQQGLKPLRFSLLLSDSATAKAQDMFSYNYWSHKSPQGKDPWTFFSSVGYKYSFAGENLAKDFYDTESLINAWMNSQTHKENILSDQYEQIGIAVVNGTLNGIKTTLVVQHFATPLISGAYDEYLQSPSSFPTQGNVLSQSNQKLISPLSITKLFAFIITSLLILALIVDGYFTIKNNTHRLTGSSLGHIAFLFIILLLVLFNQQGAVF